MDKMIFWQYRRILQTEKYLETLQPPHPTSLPTIRTEWVLSITLAGIQQFNKPYPPIGLRAKFKFFHKLRLIDSELATCYTAAMKNYCR